MLKTIRLAAVRLSEIRLDLGSQCRDLSTPKAKQKFERVLAYYRKQMLENHWDWDESPPQLFGPSMYFGSNVYIPGDGHTRIQAAIESGQRTILAKIHPGGLKEAIRYSIGPANRHYQSNLLSKEDLLKRVSTALTDRTMWGWTDRRIRDYCDDGRQTLKNKIVNTQRQEKLAHWKETDYEEFEWRTEELSRLRDVRPSGGEFIQSPQANPYPEQVEQSKGALVTQLTHPVRALVRARAKSAGMSELEWIEAAILSVDAMIAERELLIQQVESKSDDNPGAKTSYQYVGTDTWLHCQGEKSVYIRSGQTLSLVDLEISVDDDSLPVAPIGSGWGRKSYALVSIDRLKWLYSSEKP